MQRQAGYVIGGPLGLLLIRAILYVANDRVAGGLAVNPYLVRSAGVGVCAQARPGGTLLHYGVLRACGFAAGVDDHASLTAAGHETTQ